MSQHQQHIAELFDKYLSGTYSHQELRELLDHFGLEEHGEQLKSLILQQFENPVPENVNETEIDAVTKLMDIHIRQHVSKGTVRRFNAGLWIAAAAIVLLTGIGAAVYFIGYNERRVDNFTSIYGDDVLPGSNRAILTLADGRVIDLDSAQLGFLAEQQGVNITKDEDGIIIYQPLIQSQDATDAVVSNTITTPRGGQYKIILPDSTTAWLNAASSLTYPTQFTGNERKVELNGEGYFEVTHNAAQPFIVQNNEQQVQVLGTSFNIDAYKDTHQVTTTLVQGSVRVSADNTASPVTLLPGQQAVLANHRFNIKSVDVNDYISWKDGLIMLNNFDLPTIIKQLERWYDVEFINRGNLQVNVSGIISRTANLSEVLQAIENNTGVKFKIEGRRVTVLE